MYSKLHKTGITVTHEVCIPKIVCVSSIKSLLKFNRTSEIIFVFCFTYSLFIYLFFEQIEENTKGLSSLNYSFSGSTSSLESIRSPTMEINRKADGAKKTLLKWVGTVIPKYVSNNNKKIKKK